MVAASTSRPHWSVLFRPAVRQVDAAVARKRVLAPLQPGYAVVKEPRHAAPHGHVTVPKQKIPHGIAPLRSPELEDGRQTQRHGDDRVRIVALVPVLMQRQPATWRVAID